MAAGLVSAGTLAVLNAVALEGWTPRARSLFLLAVATLTFGTLVHVAGRLTVRDKRREELDSSGQTFSIGSQPEAMDMDDNTRHRNEPFPTERDVDELVQEFGDDARAAIKALLHDVEVLALDCDAVVVEGFRSRLDAALAPRTLVVVSGVECLP